MDGRLGGDGLGLWGGVFRGAREQAKSGEVLTRGAKGLGESLGTGGGCENGFSHQHMARGRSIEAFEELTKIGDQTVDGANGGAKFFLPAE